MIYNIFPLSRAHDSLPYEHVYSTQRAITSSCSLWLLKIQNMTSTKVNFNFLKSITTAENKIYPKKKNTKNPMKVKERYSTKWHVGFISCTSFVISIGCAIYLRLNPWNGFNGLHLIRQVSGCTHNNNANNIYDMR